MARTLRPRLVRGGTIGPVRLRRLLFMAFVLYVGLDVCLPDMPGAFVFDADGSVDGVDVSWTRPHARSLALPELISRDRLVPQQLHNDLKPRSFSITRVAHCGLVRRYLPRGTCVSPPVSEDPH